MNKISIFCFVLLLAPLFVMAGHTGEEVTFPDDFNIASGRCATNNVDPKVTLKFTDPHCFAEGKNVQVISGLGGEGLSDTAEDNQRAACHVIPGGKFFEYGTDDFLCFRVVSAVQTIGGALQLVNRLTNWMVTILVLFGIFYGIIGAFQFLTSAGEEKKLETGKKKIYYAIGGVVLGLLVKGIITLLVNFVGTL